MIEVEVNNKEKTKLSYPKLMKGDLSGCIVFFNKDKEGVLMTQGSPDTCIEVGAYHREWGMECFTDYQGSITLSNK